MSSYRHNRPGVGTDAYYVEKIQKILHSHHGTEIMGSPNKLLDYLFIGNYRDADNVDYLHRLGITHVLNCAAYRVKDDSPYSENSGIVGYLQFRADDDEHYDILQHFSMAKAFIDKCKRKGGKCLVHCAMGMNRSGAICAAYIMMDKRMDLLDVVTHLRKRRSNVLCNRGFQKQLVRFARMRGLINPID